MKKSSYKGQVFKILNLDPSSDMVNMEDDRPELIFGPALEGQSQDSDVAPFYISLRVHDYVLHNAMFDSGASHNLMPKAIMEKLGLDITRKYHDLYSFDSGRVRCIGLIKDLVVSLDQILAKNVLMDMVVADIPPRFGMLLSRPWGEKIKGTMQLDLSYATIPVFCQMRKLYREQKMKYMITSKEKPVNHPINYVHTDLESFVLYSDSFNDVNSQVVEVEDIPEITENFREVLKQESYVTPVFKSHSCPVVFEYLEDLEFDKQLELSLFETKSKSDVGSTTLNVEFVKDLETKKANRSIDDYILRLQTAITAINVPKILKSTSATLGSSAIASSSKIPTEPPFIPTIPVQPSISDQKSAVVSHPSTPSTLKHQKFCHHHPYLIHPIHQLHPLPQHPQD